MIIVGDSGSSTTNWTIIKDKVVVKEVNTAGFNPYYYGSDVLEESVAEAFQDIINTAEVSHIFYYAAGCSTDANCSIVRKAFDAIFPHATIEIDHDLFGAARALLQKDSGIACILGTGSNSCKWDGEKIISQASSLGYLLGDEGSGTHMGKLFVAGLLRGEAGSELTQLFYESNGMDMSAILTRLYREALPNKFLASQSRFIKLHAEHTYCKSIIEQSFDDFFKYFIKIYPFYKSSKIAFTGSVAHFFRDELTSVLSCHGIHEVEVMQKPIVGLTQYHLKYP